MSSKWDKLIKDLDKNMDQLDKNKKLSASTMLTFKKLERKLKATIAQSDHTIDVQTHPRNK